MNIRTIKKKRLEWAALLLTAITLLIGARAAVAADYGDPPGRVARIRYIQGSVSFAPAGESDWVPAVTNRPVTIGDQLWADANSRAELDMGAMVVRMNADTSLTVLNLDDRTVQIQLSQGTVDLRVHRLPRDQVLEIDTPNEAFTVTQPGTYRVEAGSDGNSSAVTVRQGQGQATGGGNVYDVYAGQTATFNGTDSLNAQVANAADPDDFDNWGTGRDHQYEQPQSARYVSRDVVGYEDLDGNGTWGADPNYGNVWYPTAIPSGWAPYRNGHWVWVSPWGWSWVDDDPWGYAPFHYGRWVSNQGRWGWVPGPVNVQPVYAPALVAFIGGPGFGMSFSLGGGADVGWFPLGPREVYVPAYQATPAYVNRVNTSNTVVNTTTITNVYNNTINNVSTTNVTYVNKSVPGAVTAVPQNVMTSSAPVAKAAVAVNQKQIASAPVVSRAAVSPSQASVLGTSNPGATRMARPPAAAIQRTVVAKTTPPPPPVPFAKQQPELAKHPGQPLPAQQVQALRPATSAAAHPLVKQAPPGKPAKLNAATGNTTPPAAQQPPAPQQAQQQGAQQAADKARQQQAQQQAAQQAADKARLQQAQQQAAQQAADKTRQQQAQQQAAQQAADKARQQQAQQQAAQQAAERTRQQQAQQQAAQQAADKARQQQAQQEAAQQAADKARQQQAQQEAAQQAEKSREQQAAQQQAAEKARQQQLAQQQAAQQAEKSREQQAAQQQAAEKARQQQAQQQAAQQAADKARQQQLAQQQAAPQRPEKPPTNPQPAPPPKPQPSQAPQAKPNQPQTPAEKAKEEQKKREQKPPPPPPE